MPTVSQKKLFSSFDTGQTPPYLPRPQFLGAQSLASCLRFSQDHLPSPSQNVESYLRRPRALTDTTVLWVSPFAGGVDGGCDDGEA